MKRILELALWTPRNALIALLLVMVGFMGTLMAVGSASDTTAAAATPTTTPTPTATDALAPIPSVSVEPIPAAPTPTVTAAAPTVPGTGSTDPATAEGTADKFMRTYLALRERDRTEWEADLLALSTGAPIEEMIRTIPASMIPAAVVVASQEKVHTASSATVEVPITNGDTYTVILALDPDGRWLVTSSAPYGGEE